MRVRGWGMKGKENRERGKSNKSEKRNERGGGDRRESGRPINKIFRKVCEI